VVFFS